MSAQAVCPQCDSQNPAGSKFCMRCGAALGALAVSTPPPRLELKLPGRLRSGASGVLELRLTNLEVAEPVEVELEIETSLVLGSRRAYAFTLEPQMPLLHVRQFLASTEGQHQIRFVVHVVSPARETFEGGVVVSVAAPTPSAQIIHYTDARKIEGKGLVRAEGANIQLPAERPPEPTEAGRFEPVTLIPQGQLAAREVKQIMPGHLGKVYPQTRLSLQVPHEGLMRNICLLAQPSVVVGRRRGNDIVLRLLPALSDTQDDPSALISGQHATVEFTPEGLVWRNLRCSNGTEIGGLPLAAETSRRLTQGISIRPAGVVGLACELFHEDLLEELEPYQRLAERVRQELPERALGGVQAVRLRRLNNLADLEEYVLFQRAVSIGSGPTCAVRLRHPSVAPVHAQILRLGHSLWIEPCQSAKVTKVDGQPLPCDTLAPLRPHLVLQLGEVECTLARFQQYYLDTAVDG